MSKEQHTSANIRGNTEELTDRGGVTEARKQSQLVESK